MVVQQQQEEREDFFNFVRSREYVECETSELIQKEVVNDEEAYKLYNDHAFKCGFGIRRGKVCWRYDTKTIRQRFLVCSRAGLKDIKTGVPKAYTKLDQRCGCKAYIQFDVSKESGLFIVTKHHMIHNHPMVPVIQRHLIRSHRKVTVEQLHMINNLRSCGVGVAEAVRVLRKEAGGSANLGFGHRDAYDAVAAQRKKELDGCDSNQLIKNFSQRQAVECDFYYDVRLDAIGHLISFFWRDGRMKRDYEVFGDLVVHDTTYRTNKYGMICGPFVGMNHHQRNVMFGVGFLLNEDTDSFVWLFESFLKSMGDRSPITIMTDQDAAMAKAISIVFPNVIHRLCIWHIGKNSINNIKGLRGKAGFVDLFNYVLKHCETKSEFKHYWTSMTTKYKCDACPWLMRLYKLRKMWCPVYSKDYFSGGVLSSQRSETTNHSLNQRLHRMQGLCDFYKVFIDVVEEWRDRENGEDYNALNGNKHLAFVDVKLLNEAKKIYTVAVYLTFEENFIRGASFCQKLVKYDPPIFEYHVGRTEKEYLMHLVRFDQENMTIDCTCKYFTEMGLLCSHSLRIFHIHNVENIPERYILGRWAKHAMCTRVDDDVGKDVNIVQASVWRVQTTRDSLAIINSTQHDIAARKVVENALSDLKSKVVLLIGKVDESITIDEVTNLLYPVVKDPPKKRKKGARNVRLKSTVEKQVNRLRGWKKTAEKAALRNKAKAQKSVQEYIDIPEECNVAHSTHNKSLLDVYGPDDYFHINHIPGEGSNVEQPHHKAALEAYHEYSEKLFGN